MNFRKMTPEERSDWRLAGLVLAAVLLLLASLALAMPAQADVLLRTCDSEPPATGAGEFGACGNSQWSTPSRDSIVLVLRPFDLKYRDVWEAASTVTSTDRVWACDDASVKPGPYVACPSKLQGRTDNWLPADSIVWPQPVSETFKTTWRWTPITTWNDGSLITEPISYVLTWWSADPHGQPIGDPQQVTTPGPPLVLDVPRQKTCANVRGLVAGVLGDSKDTACITPNVRKPGQAENLTVEIGSP